MKTIILNLILLFSIPVLLNAQCNDNLISACQSDNGGAKKLRDFPIKLKKAKKKDPSPYARYVVSLKKGSQYRFNIKNDTLNSNDAFLMLSDDYKTFGSTFNPESRTNHNYFDFYCKNSGTYYITIQFMDKKGGCAVGMLSFVDNFNVFSSK